jgi:hypothetical protein
LAFLYKCYTFFCRRTKDSFPGIYEDIIHTEHKQNGRFSFWKTVVYLFLLFLRRARYIVKLALYNKFSFTKKVSFSFFPYYLIHFISMKKNIIVFIACWAVKTGALAQVGVNTEPQGMFHVDAQSDTDGSLNRADDVIVTYEGNVGIGAFPPAAASVRLLVDGGGTPASPKSPLKIVDGQQEGGKVLTSANAGGDARWESLPGLVNPGEAYGLYGIPAATLPKDDAYNTLIEIPGFSFKAEVPGITVPALRCTAGPRLAISLNWHPSGVIIRTSKQILQLPGRRPK